MSELTFHSIDKSYGDVVAARAVSFEVRKGEVFGLLGPNGAGKTTLIRILMDIIRADGGRITLLGEPHRRDRSVSRVVSVSAHHSNPPGFSPDRRTASK